MAVPSAAQRHHFLAHTAFFALFARAAKNLLVSYGLVPTVRRASTEGRLRGALCQWVIARPLSGRQFGSLLDLKISLK